MKWNIFKCVASGCDGCLVCNSHYAKKAVEQCKHHDLYIEAESQCVEIYNRYGICGEFV
jgi:hypothetical protein